MNIYFFYVDDILMALIYIYFKTTMGKVVLNVGRLKAGSRTSSRKNSNSTGGGLRKSESTASNKSKGGRHSKSMSSSVFISSLVVYLSELLLILQNGKE